MVDTVIRESPSGPPITISGGETGVTLTSVRYVDPATTIDEEDQTGSDEAPFSTLQRAIDSIAAAELTNATIFLIDGDYGEAGAEYAPIEDDILQIIGFGSAQNIGAFTIPIGSGSSRLTFQNLCVSPSVFSFESNTSGGTYEFFENSMVGNVDAPSSTVVLRNTTLTGALDTSTIDATNSNVSGAITFASTLTARDNCLFQSTVTSDGVEASIDMRNNCAISDAVDLPNSTSSVTLDYSTLSNGLNLPNGSVVASNDARIAETTTTGGIISANSTFGIVDCSGSIEASGGSFSTVTCVGGVFTDCTIQTLTSTSAVTLTGGTIDTIVTAPSVRALGTQIGNIVADFSDAIVTELIGCRILTSTITNGRIAGGTMFISNAVAPVELVLTGVTCPDGGGIAADTLTMIGCAIGCGISASDGRLTACHWIDGTHVISGTTLDEWRFESTLVPDDFAFGASSIAAIVTDSESWYRLVELGVFGAGGVGGTTGLGSLTFLDPPIAATISITVPAVADGAVGYVDTTLVGTPLEDVFSAANQPVIVNPQTDLVAAGAGGGFINARISAANTLRSTFIGPLAGGAANFTVTRAR